MSTDAGAFAIQRKALEGVVAAPHGREIYTAKRRSIYHIPDSELGPLAVKEMRNRDPLRRLRFGYFQEHRALREFRVGAAFAARGGRTPAFFAAAQEHSLLGQHRVFLFIHWLEGATTLTEYFRNLESEPDEVTLATVATSLVAAAELGLCHGRHSSENLLVVTSAQPLDLYTIDFAYSHLTEALDPPSLIADTARIAHRLVFEGACSRDTANALFAAVATRAWPDSPTGPQKEMQSQLTTALTRTGQRPQTDR